MQLAEHIFLTGFMGSGKTSFSKRLAKHLKLDCIDLDAFITQAEDCSVDQLFENKGEEYFRNIETQYLKKIIALKKPHVIALGGGTICFNNNLQLIKQHGILLYIELPTKTLFQRLENAKDCRPLLKNLNGSNLLVFIEQKLEERKLYYQQAHITLNGLTISPTRVAQQLIDFQKKNN
jgi:shikimate kinase